MDYKMWIVLFGIVLLILYLIKEMYFIKFDLINYINTHKNNNEENNMIIRKNFQNDLNVLANKIKLLNEENLQQFRKITILNNQPIIKNNNHFREMGFTDSDIDNKDLKYLSDSKIMSKKENSSKFSETSDSEKNIIIDKKNKAPLSVSNDVITNVLNNVINKALNTQLIFDEITFNKNSDTNIRVIEIIEENKSQNKMANIIEINTESKTEERTENATENATDDKTENATEDKTESKTEDKTESKTEDKTENVTEDKIENTIEIETESDVDSTSISDTSSQIIINKDDLEFKNNNFSNKIGNKELIENAENVIFDTITIGTKKSKNKREENKANKNDLNEINIPNEIAININKENLKSIDDYTLETLKNLAKKFNIQLSIKNSGKWKSLNKTEIYSEISKFLNKKNLN